MRGCSYVPWFSFNSENSVQGKAWVAPLPDHLDLSKAIMRQIRKDKDKDKDGHRDSSRRGEDIKVELEIAPVRMQAKLKGGTLSLVAADGTVENISLQGCEVLAVSSTPGPQRKWCLSPYHDFAHGSFTTIFFLLKLMTLKKENASSN